VGQNRFRRRPVESFENFEDFSVQMYGREVASRFLLNYSQKLWGLPCRRLSPMIAGDRMRELKLRTFLTEAVRGQSRKVRHFEGSFYYPTYGIGSIMDALADTCGKEHIRLQSDVTRVHHDGDRIRSIDVSGRQSVQVGNVVSTLPLNFLLERMVPPVPDEVLDIARRLRYRDMVLVLLALDKPHIAKDIATVYFPEKEFPFTRISEPKNRSRAMAPDDKSSLIVEIPCQRDDGYGRASDEELTALVVSHLERIGWITRAEILDQSVVRMANAYPVLEVGFQENIDLLFNWLDRFRNLQVCGRSGSFCYSWIHDMMLAGRECVMNLLSTA
jgi:protoporphyrinogen oxidase